MRDIKEIIIHCAATPEGKNFTVKDIDVWHKARGFKGIGYHYVIYLDGSIHAGRPESEIGAHCKGYNKTSIGICYIGGIDKMGKPKDTRTKEQKEAFIKLIKDLKSRYPKAKVYNHNKFANKACPSFDAEKEYANI